MRKKMYFYHVYFSREDGAGAEEANEGNRGADDIYGFDEPDEE